MEHLSIMRHEVSMRRSIVLTGKHGMAALILELKEAGGNEEAILVHMH